MPFVFSDRFGLQVYAHYRTAPSRGSAEVIEFVSLARMGQVVRVFPLQFGRRRVILWEREGDEWEIFVRGKSGVLRRRSISAKVAAAFLNPAPLVRQPISAHTHWTWLEGGRERKPNDNAHNDDLCST
jgi:hypothetical protein